MDEIEEKGVPAITCTVSSVESCEVLTNGELVPPRISSFIQHLDELLFGVSPEIRLCHNALQLDRRV